MTHRRNREHDRAVRKYQREHPGTSLDQARKAVAARTGRQPGLPSRIPAAPQPRRAERLEGYVQRVAAAVGVQRHRAMELLGLEPGTSATARLDELADGLPDRTVRALVAATGMTNDQARSLTAPRPARPDLKAARRMAERNLSIKSSRRGGEGKTSSARVLAHALALHSAPLLFDIDRPGNLEALSPALPPTLPVDTLLIDTPWPADGRPLPADPATLEALTQDLAADPDTGTDTPPQ